MTCPERLILVYEVWGLKKEVELTCKKDAGHKAACEPALPPNIRFQGSAGRSWAIKISFKAPKATSPSAPREKTTEELKAEWLAGQR